MTKRQQWIQWGFMLALAIAGGLLSQRPIQIPPFPATPPNNQSPDNNGEPDGAQPDPLNAIVRISRTGVGCSATIIGPRRADGRYWVLSAAHCCDKIGERWVARFRDGRTTGLVVSAISRGADYAWLLTDVDTSRYPYALLADADPKPGEKVWHAGYGTDNPGNREEGEVVDGPNRDGQIHFKLSVSPGDSGGGIVLDAQGRIVSSVCCTTAPGRLADVWGTSPVVAKRGQTMGVGIDDWNPLPIPVVAPEDVPAKMQIKRP